jgi:hypothetical protein
VAFAAAFSAAFKSGGSIAIFVDLGSRRVNRDSAILTVVKRPPTMIFGAPNPIDH